MTTIKLYDSAINAINGQSNPQSQVGDTQNVDIQDILEMIREGRVTEAVELLDQAGITSMTTEENGTKVVTFKFDNRNYTIRYNPVSENTETTGTTGTIIPDDTASEKTQGSSNSIINVDRTQSASKQIEELLQQLQEKYPDIYEQYAALIIEATGGKHGMCFINSTEIGIGEYICNSQFECDNPADNFLLDVLKYATGTTTDYGYGSKLENFFVEEIGASKNSIKSQMKADIIDIMNYLLGDNDEGINYFYSMSGKEASIWETYSGTPGEYNQIGDSEYFEKDGKYYYFTEKYKQFNDGYYTWDADRKGYMKLHPYFYDRAKAAIGTEANTISCEVDLSEVQEAIKAAKTNGTTGSTSGTTTAATSTSSAAKATSPVVSTEPTMDVGGVSITESDVEAQAAKLKQEKLDEFLKKINQFNNYSYQAPGWFDSGDIPIYAVDLDANGNIIISDKFKEALKAYLQGLVDAEKADLELYNQNIEYNKIHAGGAGSSYTQYCQPQFLEMLGLTEIPYSHSQTDMNAWIANIQSYIDDDSKMEELLANFCGNIGSTDGKTVSLDQYYSALADNNIYEHITSPSRKTTFATDEDIHTDAKLDAYLAELKEKYPEVYEEYALYIKQAGNDFSTMYYHDGIVRGDSYVDLQGSDSTYYYPFLNDVLRTAAGITGDETYTEQRAKMTELFTKMGAEGQYMEIDITRLMNYLLGDNSEGVNYFDTLKAQRTAVANQLNNTILETGAADSSIKVEQYTPSEFQGIGESDSLATEIKDYLKDLLDPIYAKYYATDGDEFVNFVLGESDWNNPDSGDYAHITWSWRDDSVKEACAKEIEAVIAKVLEKYSDVLTSIVYDGQRVLFTTIYDDDTPDVGYCPINECTTGETGALNGLAHGVCGYIDRGGTFALDPSIFEAAVDSPIMYSSEPKVYENNIPANAPVGINGETVFKTAWDGIWISEDQRFIYLWDSKGQKYLAVSNYVGSVNGSSLAQSLANGYADGLPYGDNGYDIDNIIMSLVYGYNRTDCPYIFEKDGKYYAYDNSVTNHREGLKGLEAMLREVTISSSQTSSNAKSAPATSSVPAATVSSDEEVIIKAEDCLQDMAEAAKKLGLSASETDGIYYNFTNDGSYLYVWNPVEKKFKTFSINTRKADGSINQEFTQTGKAIQRTEAYIYYEAILAAYKNGYNFTVNFPWVCEKDGLYYEYDKEAGVFKKRS